MYKKISLIAIVAILLVSGFVVLSTPDEALAAIHTVTVFDAVTQEPLFGVNVTFYILINEVWEEFNVGTDIVGVAVCDQVQDAGATNWGWNVNNPEATVWEAYPALGASFWM